MKEKLCRKLVALHWFLLVLSKCLNWLMMLPRILRFYLCAGTKIIESSEQYMMAAVDVSKAGIRKTFVTRNQLVEARAIEMQLVDGPFKKLVGGWTFTELDASACKVELNLDFEFANGLMDAAFGKVFRDLTNNMMGAFTSRAKEIYGF